MQTTTSPLLPATLAAAGPAVGLAAQLKGHSDSVLCLKLNKDETMLCSGGEVILY